MTERSVTHATFVIERTYDAAPARVFAAWADPAVKARWFAGPDEWESANYDLDFRVGGRERASGGPPGGPVHTYDARYQDIVQDQRIILTYDMHLDDTRISVSLATVEFRPEGAGTRLVFTEQGAFLDSSDHPARRARRARAICWTRWARHCGARPRDAFCRLTRRGHAHVAQALFPPARILLSQGAHSLLRE